MGEEFIEELRSATRQAMHKKRQDIMRARFLAKI